MDIYDITASALTAQRVRMDTISGNLANVNTTRQADGTLGAYKRRNVVFAPLMKEATDGPGGGTPTTAQMGADGRLTFQTGVVQNQMPTAGVQVMSVEEDTKTPTRKVYDPNHPDADPKGFVELPNINVVTEMVDMIAASRAYEASVTAFQSAKSMSESVLQM